MKLLVVLSALVAVAVAGPGIIAVDTLARDAVVNHAQIAVAQTQGAIAAAQGTAAHIDAQATNFRDAVVNAAQVNVARAQGAAAAIDGHLSSGYGYVAAPGYGYVAAPGLGLPLDAHIAARINSGLFVL